MFKRMKTIELMVKTCMGVKPKQTVFILTDDYARSVKVGQQIAERCSEEGAHPALCIIERFTHNGQEPPKPVAEAMQSADLIVNIAETYHVIHTAASKKAFEKGVRFFVIFPQVSEDYLDKDISIEDLKKIKERTEKLAEAMTNARRVRITTPYGTDIRFSIEGRKATVIQPLGSGSLTTLPDYAEATIAPLEGTTEGILVVDASVQGWYFLLREPMKLVIKEGRVTEALGPKEYVQKFKNSLTIDENASNCAAEFAIGTSHLVPKDLRGNMWDYAIVGNIHIAVGRNTSLGGVIPSQLHLDTLITKGTVWLDDVCIQENGELKI